MAELFDELLEHCPRPVEAGYWTTVFALALALTDQHERFAALDLEGPSRWGSAARLVTRQRYAEAADELAAIGGRPEEALARLLDAQALIRQGSRPRAASPRSRSPSSCGPGCGRPATWTWPRALTAQTA